MPLKTDYKNDIFTGNRKYNEIVNPDGTKSFEDVTEYSIEGDEYGAAEVNEENNVFNDFALGNVQVDISAANYTLQTSEYNKGTIIVTAASVAYALILPTGYNYKYVIVNRDTANQAFVKKNGGAVISIPPSTVGLVAFEGSEYELIAGNPQGQFHIITATNGNTFNVYPYGISYSYIIDSSDEQSGQADNTNFPGPWMQTINIKNTNTLVQFVINVITGAEYHRVFSNGIWKPWRRIDVSAQYYTNGATLSLQHMKGTLYIDSSVTKYIGIPTDAEDDLPNGYEVAIVQHGTAQVVISPHSGVTLRSENDYLKSDGQNTTFVLTKIDADLWLASGRLTNDTL